MSAGFGLRKSFISMTRPYFGSQNPLQRPVGCLLAAPRPPPPAPVPGQGAHSPRPLSCAPRATALDRYGLQKAGFTHVLNAAHGRRNVDTGPDYYRDMDIEYHGVEADDVPTFDLSVFFYSAAAFIDGALHADHSKSPAHQRPRPRRPRPRPAGRAFPSQSRPCGGSMWMSWKSSSPWRL